MDKAKPMRLWYPSNSGEVPYLPCLSSRVTPSTLSSRLGASHPCQSSLHSCLAFICCRSQVLCCVSRFASSVTCSEIFEKIDRRVTSFKEHTRPQKAQSVGRHPIHPLSFHPSIMTRSGKHKVSCHRPCGPIDRTDSEIIGSMSRSSVMLVHLISDMRLRTSTRVAMVSSCSSSKRQ